MVDRQVEGVRAGTTRGVGVVVRVGAGSGVRGAVPDVAVAGGHGLGVVGAVVDGQVEGDDTVRAVLVAVCPLVIPGLGVGPAVPVVAFAGVGGELAGGGVIDSEVQGIDLCATVTVDMLVIVGARSVVGLPVSVSPGVGVVGGDGDGGVRRVVDGQVQGDHGVAARGVGQSVGRGLGALGVGHAVDPGEALAGHLRVDARAGVVDRQVEGVRAGTTCAVGVVVRVGAGSGVGLTIAVCPSVASTFCNSDGGVRRVVDGQVQGIDLSTTVSVPMTVGVVAGGSVGQPVAVRPCVSLALCDGDGGVRRVVDGQVQRVNLRATVGILELIRVSSRCGVGFAVPCVAFTGLLRVGLS